MKCLKCKKPSVAIIPKALCKEHFCKSVEERAKEVSKKLIKKNAKVAVAASGGKDSTVLLFILKKLGYDVHAVAIDEGIAGYRDKSLIELKEFTDKYKIPLDIHSYKDAFGFSLDEYTKKNTNHTCMACGVLRRQILNEKAHGYDLIATGHNLDDETQSIMMNLCLNNLRLLARLGPKTGAKDFDMFTPRIKPLYFVLEREILTYAHLNGIAPTFMECPNMKSSIRNKLREYLDELEFKKPGVKLALAKWFLKILPRLRKKFAYGEPKKCRLCGNAAENDLCKACQIKNTMPIVSTQA